MVLQSSDNIQAGLSCATATFSGSFHGWIAVALRLGHSCTLYATWEAVLAGSETSKPAIRVSRKDRIGFAFTDTSYKVVKLYEHILSDLIAVVQ